MQVTMPPPQGAIFQNLDIIVSDRSDAYLTAQSLAISEDKIVGVFPVDQPSPRFDSWPKYNMSGYLVTSGLVNSHTHAPMSFFRGLGHSQTPSTAGNRSMIEDFFFPAEKKLSHELIEPLSYSYLLDGLRCGVTCFSDAYFFSEGVARAAEKLGLKAAIGEHHADLGGPHLAGEKHWQKTKKTIEAWPFSNRVRPLVYAHAADTVSKPLLTKLSAYALESGLPFHMHLSQTIGERERVWKRDGISPVKYAEECQVLRDNALLVHLLSADNEDLKMIADSGAKAVLCPQSEIIYEGVPPLASIIEHDLEFLIGTDCAASCDGSDVHAEAKFLLMLLMTQGIRQPGMLQQVYAALTYRAYDSLGFENTGRVLEGARADLVFYKKDIALEPFSDPLVNFFFSLQSRHVAHVMIDGEWVLFNKEPARVQEKDLMDEYQMALKEIRQRTGLPIRQLDRL